MIKSGKICASQIYSKLLLAHDPFQGRCEFFTKHIDGFLSIIILIEAFRTTWIENSGNWPFFCQWCPNQLERWNYISKFLDTRFCSFTTNLLSQNLDHWVPGNLRFLDSSRSFLINCLNDCLLGNWNICKSIHWTPMVFHLQIFSPIVCRTLKYRSFRESQHLN